MQEKIHKEFWGRSFIYGDIMKYIQYRSGKGKNIYHLSVTNAAEHKGRFKYEYLRHERSSMPEDLKNYDVTYCDGNHTFDPKREVFDHPPTGSLCERCKKKFIRNFSEEELFMELM